jgi:hypothetical protein
MAILTVPYQLLTDSFDTLSNFKPREVRDFINQQALSQQEEYLVRSVGIHNPFTQLFAPSEVIDMMINVEEFKETLLSESAKLSVQLKRTITLRFSFMALYFKYESIIEEIAMNGKDSQQKFRDIMSDLQLIKKLDYLHNISSQLNKKEFNDYFYNAVQIQNYLFRTKTPLIEYSQRDH